MAGILNGRSPMDTFIIMNENKSAVETKVTEEVQCRDTICLRGGKAQLVYLNFRWRVEQCYRLSGDSKAA